MDFISKKIKDSLVSTSTNVNQIPEPNDQKFRVMQEE